jgi:putative cardiolipin synthase
MSITGLCACASLPDNSNRVASHAYHDTWQTTLGQTLERLSQGHEGKSGFFLLEDGLDAFVARTVLARAAERSIDAQYYIIRKDTVGYLFIDQLYQAAERGVRVRLLVDDIDLEDRDVGAATLDSHPNIEVRIFNPFGRNVGRTIQLITGFGRQTRRAHNKSYTVDNQATILGGRNIGAEYFNANPGVAFLDLDVLSIGPVAREVSSSFDQYWNNELSYPISTLVADSPTVEQFNQRKQEFDARVAEYYESEYMQYLHDSDLAQQLRERDTKYSWGLGSVVADDPAKLVHDTSASEFHLSEQLGPYFEGVKTELVILSPYFVPGKNGVKFLQKLRDRGVRVKILTNSLSSTDVPIVHAGYARYRRALLDMGIELYELNRELSKAERKALKEGGIGRSKASLHAKAFVFDRQQVFIGSLNLDPRSLIQNTEIGVVFESTELAQRIAQAFDHRIDQVAFRLVLEPDAQGKKQIIWYGQIENRQQIRYVDPYTSFWKRLGVGLLGLLPIESQI